MENYQKKFYKTMLIHLEEICKCIDNFVCEGESSKDETSGRLLEINRDYQECKPRNNSNMFRLAYDRNDPSVLRNYHNSRISEGGDNLTVDVSSAQSIEKGEDENLKNLTKRKDGRWQASKVIEGKRVFAYGKTQREASDKLSKLGTRRTRETKRESLDKFAIWWLDTYKKGNLTEKSYKNYLWTINAHIGNITTPINRVTTIQLQELLNGLPATRIRREVYKLIRQIFRKAFELDFIKKDVSEFLSVGVVKENIRDSLSISEQQRLIEALGNDMFSRRVMFYLCTGARPAEIATVRKEELRKNWLKINGTKTRNAVRWVKISEKLSDMLLGESPEFFKFDNKRFREHLQDFCKKNRICENIDVYTLRHTFATNLYILKVAEKDRQIYLGHSAGSAITNAVYTTFSPDIKPVDIYNIYGAWLPEF